MARQTRKQLADAGPLTAETLKTIDRWVAIFPPGKQRSALIQALIINQFDPKTSAVQADQFAEHVGIKPAQVIQWDPQLFGTAATNAAPLLEVGAKSKVAQSVRDLSAHLLGRNEANIARPKFSLSGLFKKK